MRELLERERAAVDAELEHLLPRADAWPTTLHRAMRHAVLGGGKRVRPMLARLAHQAAGGNPDEITAAACGLELIHAYSLVHDDLPALDNDLLRRGRATVHAAFGEATAILVGDALLSEGMLLLGRHPAGEKWARRRLAVTTTVAEAVGSRGMVGGQMEDLEATGQISAAEGAPVFGCAPAERLERIHRHKTGCLLRAAVETGALLAGVETAGLAAFSAYGERLGLAFQIADDILDATATAAELGKSPGKDQAGGKLTYVTLYGLAAARARLAEAEEAMVELARDLEGGDGPLGGLARFVARRRS